MQLFLVKCWLHHVIFMLQVGWTPLYVAAREGHVEVVTLLLSKGANKEAADRVCCLDAGVMHEKLCCIS